MPSLNVSETTKKKVGNGSLEFKEICSRVISLRVISIKMIVEEQLTQAGVEKSNKGNQLRKMRKASAVGENQEIMDCKSPEKMISREEVVSYVECC